MTEDSELLRRYVQNRSQAAFSELVERRVNLVYSVALRTVGGDAHLAEDVTQKVFADLARKAPTLLERPVLSGWLYRSAQYAGTDVVRSERRRRTREQETHLMNEPTGNAGERPGDWEKLKPVLDEAMAELNDDDRDAVALRFFEERPFAEIGSALRLSEDTARKRVERALDKLHAILARRGLTSSTAALGLVLANHVAGAAPSGLAAAVSGAAMANAAGAGGWAAMAGGVKLTLSAACVAATVAVGTAVFQTQRAASAEVALAQAQSQETALRARLQTSERQAQAAVQRASAAEQDTAQLLAAVQGRIQELGGAPTAGGGPGVTRTSRAAVATVPPMPKLADGQGITHDYVEARYRRALALAASEQFAEALKEYLWCYDEGMVRVASYTGVRQSFLLGNIERLGKAYPPALAALRERRDAAEQAMKGRATDFDAVATYGSINRVLGEEARTLATMETYPENDLRRNRLADLVMDRLVESQRYVEALRAHPYARMLSLFESNSGEAPAGYSAGAKEARRHYLVSSTLQNIEILAGAGDGPHARSLADRLVAFDGSSETKAAVRSGLQRAGHPELSPP